MSGALQHIDNLHVDWTKWEGLIHHRMIDFVKGYLDRWIFGWPTFWCDECTHQPWQRTGTGAYNWGGLTFLFCKAEYFFAGCPFRWWIILEFQRATSAVQRIRSPKNKLCSEFCREIQDSSFSGMAYYGRALELMLGLVKDGLGKETLWACLTLSF